MNKLQKKILCAILMLALMLPLAACGEESELPEEYETYVIPWEVDAPAQAKKDGRIHYYFMAGEGMIIDPDSQYPEKWGDSTLIVFPSGETMLIDTGMEVYAPVLVENLRRLGVKKLDYLVFSHPHDDHAHAAFPEGGVLDSIEVGKIYHSGLVNENWKKYIMVDECAAYGVPVEILKKGDVLEIGGVRMEVLHPEDCTGRTSGSTPEINNLSLVIRFDYGEHSSLFTGDIYVETEKDLVLEYKDGLDVDLLKMPHHGTEISNCQAFARMTSPEIAVAMGRRTVLRENYYYYAAEGTRVLIDEHDGYIHVSSDGSDLIYETSRERVIDTELEEQYAALDESFAEKRE